MRIGLFDKRGKPRFPKFSNEGFVAHGRTLGVVWHDGYGGLTLGNIGESGGLGVAMFFVLSGFLIVTLLLREKTRNDRRLFECFDFRCSELIDYLDHQIVNAVYSS